MPFVKSIRRSQTIISIIIFIMIFIGCWYVTDFKITEIQLSYWGLESKISSFWNIAVMLISVSMFFNVRYYIMNHNRMIYKKTLYYMFISVFIAQFIIGLVTMNHELHNLVAYYYFFVYPLSIFMLSYLNRKTIQYREWLGNLIFSISMVLLPLIFIHFFKGMAISEISHCVVVLLWSLWILKDNF